MITLKFLSYIFGNGSPIYTPGLLSEVPTFSRGNEDPENRMVWHEMLCYCRKMKNDKEVLESSRL